MTVALAVTDHALLRWMERAYGVDIETWRSLCLGAAEAALDEFAGTSVARGPAFIIDQDGTVITYIAAGCSISRATGTAVVISAPTPAAA